jgi:AraC-like DNA-binding protein
VDPLADFLDGPRAREAFVLRSLLEPPWALRVQDEAPLTVVAIVRGNAWITMDDEKPIALTPGDVAVVLGPGHYTVADDPSTSPNIVIQPGQHCETPSGEPLKQAMDLGVRTWGNSATGSVAMLTGTYQTDSEVSRRLLESLPALTVVSAETWRSPIVDLLADEISKDAPGQQVVLDRLLDLLLVGALREALSSGGASVPAWYRATEDPIVGRVLGMMHNQPDHPWTVAGLAAAVGLSRAALARRFRDQVGEPPLGYLTGWRMTLAADLLRSPGATVGGVARNVGYSSPFTFSTAFKRAFGLSPRDYRNHRDAPSSDAESQSPRPIPRRPIAVG